MIPVLLSTRTTTAQSRPLRVTAMRPPAEVAAGALADAARLVAAARARDVVAGPEKNERREVRGARLVAQERGAPQAA